MNNVISCNPVDDLFGAYYRVSLAYNKDFVDQVTYDSIKGAINAIQQSYINTSASHNTIH
jgi:hypothetical protein